MTSAAVISIVEDDEMVRSGIDSLLQSHDYTVHTFASAEEFLNSPEIHRTACLISDVRMPGLSGIALQARLYGEGYHIPIIFITAHPDEHVRSCAIRAGASAFLNKPIGEAELISSLDRALKHVKSLD